MSESGALRARYILGTKWLAQLGYKAEMNCRSIIGQVICNFLCINLVPWIIIYVLSLEAALPFLNASKKIGLF